MREYTFHLTKGNLGESICHPREGYINPVNVLLISGRVYSIPGKVYSISGKVYVILGRVYVIPGRVILIRPSEYIQSLGRYM